MSAPRPGRLVLLGCPVSHSLSPRFQNAALEAAGVALEYEPLHVEPDALESVAAALAKEGAAGNVTVPHKERFTRLCTRLSPLARRVGAVNTFWCEDGGLAGDNTDVGGFERLARLALGREPGPERVALLGAGGSAAAVLAAVAGWAGAEVAIHARTPERARELLRRIGVEGRVAPTADAALAGATLVVNATPLGMRDELVPVEVESLPPGAAVADLVYREGETHWVRAARDRGHRAVDGLEMLLEQGALAFERWFGFAPDRAAMRTAVEGGRRS